MNKPLQQKIKIKRVREKEYDRNEKLIERVVMSEIRCCRVDH
jgi:hypothetical protein